ncbi:MAG: 30S ribosomal protein S6e [Candidatus Bathyarchaeia archaeon]
MAKFKIIVSDPKTGKSKSVEVEGARATPLIGRKIGDIVDGSVVGMPGVKLIITGGSDKDGFPMRPDVHGGVKTRILLSSGVGFKPKDKGERRRKMVRGNTITEDILQINMRIMESEEEKTTATGEEAA